MHSEMYFQRQARADEAGQTHVSRTKPPCLDQDYMMHPYRSLKHFHDVLISNFGWKFAVQIGVMSAPAHPTPTRCRKTDLMRMKCTSNPTGWSCQGPTPCGQVSLQSGQRSVQTDISVCVSLGMYRYPTFSLLA